jgi:large subunit ribosomal protein L18
VKSSKKNVEVARDLGRVIGERAKARGILKMVFDRRWYRYHGRVKAFVEGVREAGIEI